MSLNTIYTQLIADSGRFNIPEGMFYTDNLGNQVIELFDGDDRLCLVELKDDMLLLKAINNEVSSESLSNEALVVERVRNL